MCWVVLVVSLLLIVPVRRGIDRRVSAGAAGGELLYLPSGAVLRRLSLGNEGLLADIYWTRVIQYFGRKRLAHATEFPLLGPLLRITTELDPHLLVAYRYGAIFLAERPPQGAGKPEEALQLLRRGMAADPGYWHYWQDVGFVYYWDLKDYAAAARAFEAGSRMPGAQPWMEALAANVAARGGDIRTSRLLWLQTYRQPGNEQIRKSAEEHLAAIDAEIEIEELNALLVRYRSREAHPAGSFSKLVAGGYLSAIPLDPSGVPFTIGSDGRARLSPESKIDLRLLQ